jgi:hypothetical protein
MWEGAVLRLEQSRSHHPPPHACCLALPGLERGSVAGQTRAAEGRPELGRAKARSVDAVAGRLVPGEACVPEGEESASLSPESWR